MNVSQVGSAAPVPSTPDIDNKRAALQAILLRKSLENQQQQSDAMTRAADGKGQTLDVRC